MRIELGEPLFKFSVALPKGRGKKKNQIATLNNIHTWHWKSVNDIKLNFKELLTSWFIPEPTKKYEALTVVYQLYRPNKKILDVDNIGYVVKWTNDAIKERQWLIDDNQVAVILLPTMVNKELIETYIEVEVYENSN